MSSILGSVAGLLWVLSICEYASTLAFGGNGLICLAIFKGLLDLGGSIQYVWLSAVFYLFGNLSSANAMVYSMAADSCPETKR